MNINIQEAVARLTNASMDIERAERLVQSQGEQAVWILQHARGEVDAVIRALSILAVRDAKNNVNFATGVFARKPLELKDAGQKPVGGSNFVGQSSNFKTPLQAEIAGESPACPTPPYTKRMPWRRSHIGGTAMRDINHWWGTPECGE